MRDENRLDTFYNNIMQLHKNYFPDWRFGQLIENFRNYHMKIYGSDIFYIEEKTFFTRLTEFKDWLGVNYVR